jgi:hypothetical protein
MWRQIPLIIEVIRKFISVKELQAESSLLGVQSEKQMQVLRLRSHGDFRPG